MDAVTQVSRKSKHPEAAATSLLWGEGRCPGWGAGKGGGPCALISLETTIRKLPKSSQSSSSASAGWEDLGNIGASCYSVQRKDLTVPKSVSECKRMTGRDTIKSFKDRGAVEQYTWGLHYAFTMPLRRVNSSLLKKGL